MENKIDTIRCVHCDSAFIYYKIKDKVWQCRKCGKTCNPKIEEVKEE